MDHGMNKTAGRRLAALALGATLSVTMTSEGWAQMMPGMPPMPGTGGLGQQRGPQAEPDKPHAAPVDVLPGAKARIPAAPMTKPANDMQPTEALFDAINRGDIVAARDALSRGADLNGVNVLGMTPMELSVDLGRNDITFLLLSLRGEDGGRGSRAAAHSEAAAAPAKTAQGKPVKAGRGKQQREAAAKPVPVATKAVATPKLFAQDGGTPQPSAGFLGFGSHASSN
jgi:hypothetical protein